MRALGNPGGGSSRDRALRGSDEHDRGAAYASHGARIVADSPPLETTTGAVASGFSARSSMTPCLLFSSRRAPRERQLVNEGDVGARMADGKRYLVVTADDFGI